MAIQRTIVQVRGAGRNIKITNLKIDALSDAELVRGEKEEMRRDEGWFWKYVFVSGVSNYAQARQSVGR